MWIHTLLQELGLVEGCYVAGDTKNYVFLSFVMMKKTLLIAHFLQYCCAGSRYQVSRH